MTAIEPPSVEIDTSSLRGSNATMTVCVPDCPAIQRLSRSALAVEGVIDRRLWISRRREDGRDRGDVDTYVDRPSAFVTMPTSSMGSKGFNR